MSDTHLAGHRLHEGFLLRVGRRADARDFVLRGGMAVRHWLPDEQRPARDVDLVCGLPYDAGVVRSRVAAILAEPAEDGVVFEADGFRLDGIWTRHRIPGFRLCAAGRVDGRPADFSADLTFHLPLWPDPVQVRFVGERGEAPLWVCRPETILGRKVQVLTEHGPEQFRPKDLLDLRGLLARYRPEAAVLAEAVARALEGYAETLDDVRAAFGAGGWWDTPLVRIRWEQLGQRDRVAPRDLGAVVDEVRAALSAALGA